MTPLFCATALFALLNPLAAIRVNVDSRNGDIISGDHVFRVTVDSTSAINQVEFYVDGDLRDTETSTPYLFHLDTLGESEGSHKLRFKAYTVENATGETTLTVRFDNGLSKGAAYHVQEANNALSNSDWQKAVDEGRIALKIDPKNNDARLALVRGYSGLKVYDQAQKYAQDALDQDPNNDMALQLMSGIQIRRAFSTFAREGTQQNETLTTIGEAFKSAVESRRKSLDLEVDKAGDASGANLIPFVDTAIRADRYSLAIEKLQPQFDRDRTNNAVTDRLAFSLLRSGRTPDALRTLVDAKKMTTLDAYGDALLSVTYLQLNDDQNSDAAMKDALLSDSDDLGVKTAEAFEALKRDKTAVLSKLAQDLDKEDGSRPDVAYFLMALADRQQRFSDARAYFERAVLAEPAYPDLYIEQANSAIGLSQDGKIQAQDKDQLYAEARMYYQTALDARPEAADALSGLCAVSLLQKNIPDALKYGQAARDAAPKEGLGHYAFAAACEAAGQAAQAQTESLQAGRLDQANLAGRSVPDAKALWRYLISGGRLPVMARPH